MIAVDTSALMAIALDEPEVDACSALLQAEEHLIISAGTVAEALIVAERRNVGKQVARLINELGFEFVAVTAASARRVAKAYKAWGKGVHHVALNFGDRFSYEVAKEYRCRSLYVGEDFAETDIHSAL